MEKNIVHIPYVIHLADSIMKRVIGLMFRKKPIVNEGLWIIPCNAVHMFFVRFPIDIVFINKQNEVVKVYHSLKPWKMTKPVKTAYSTLELPDGSIKKLGIEIGCIVKF
ncbi:DUF192 domain-containing protein [Neobacillus rhizophilus]|uniref:DUF192 domain-containing protein n=1 Tax=Neobacillus rhizophilus TaxID=2833579 RepID=A0A942U296_9BACI|nr:DUF192 domain-containing protein [Neobacillus rhizophilus]MBS4213276.1 DUF192 domain-containing protein [Neobacillus rhizophilus]